MRDNQSNRDLAAENERPSIIKHMAVFVILTGIVIGAVWFFNRDSEDEIIILEKLAAQLLMPIGLIWYSLIFITYFAFVCRMRSLAFFSFLTVTLLTLAGNGMIANRLVSSLESEYFDTKPLEADPYDTLIVLGGGGTFPATGEAQLGGSGDRIALAAQMYHAGKVQNIFCTGSKIESLGAADQPDAGEIARTLLERLGVPSGKIETVAGRNTREEMKSLVEKFAEEQSPEKQSAGEETSSNADNQTETATRVGLITSAWHMPRAMRLAETAGLEVEPVPADFLTGPEKITALSLVPTDGALELSSRVAKEYLARLAGQ